MQIRAIGGHQQYSIKGRILNVPTDVAENINILPGLPQQTAIIAAALKKSKNFKSNVMFQSVRPKAILDALNFLNGLLFFKNQILQSTTIVLQS